MKNNIGMILQKNRFAFNCLFVAQDNIVKGNNPIYNPICMFGLSKQDRFVFFFRVFNKDFNKLHKSRYVSCKNIKSDEEFDLNVDLVIIENVQFLVDDIKLQEKVCSIIDECLERNIQIILCSDLDTQDLVIGDKLKSRLSWGILLHLED